MSRRLCIIPFINLSPRPDGKPKVCSDGNHKFLPKDINLHQQPIEEFWNCDFMKKLRMDMIHGVDIPHCEWCNYLDDTNGLSKRKSINNRFLSKYKKRIAEANANNGYLNSKPVHWEFRFSKKCNLACLSCSPTNSTLIEKQLKKHRSKITPYDQNKLEIALKANQTIKINSQNSIFIDQLWENIEHIEEIELHGGEPFYDKTCIDTLERIAVAGFSKNISLNVHSNMTNVTEKIIDILNQYKKVYFKASIDGLEEKNDFIRWPSNWKTINQNMLLVDKKLNAKKTIAGTVSLYNCTSLDELYIWQMKNFPDWHLQWHVAYFPKRLSLNLLSKKVRQEQVDKLDAIKNFNDGRNEININNIIPSLLVDYKLDKQLLKEFVTFCRSMDTIRNQNTLKIFPHLKELFDLYDKIVSDEKNENT